MKVHFDPHIESQLKVLAAQHGKSVDFYVLEAVKSYLEDVQDVAKAKQVLSENNRTWTQEEIEHELGIHFTQQ